MNPLLRRALVRHLNAWTLLSTLAAPVAWADEVDPAALELPAAADLAVAAQPLLDAQRAAVHAASQTAIANAQLPDPMLVAGITDVPVDGPGRYSLSKDSDTQFMVGLKQTFPGIGKRGLRLTRGQAEADRLSAELDEQTSMVRREASMAWLDVWKAVQSQIVLKATLAEAGRQEEAVEIAYQSGRAAQADLYGVRVAAELLRDQLASLDQQEVHARNQLRRWIGPDADRLLCPDLPDWPAPDLAKLLQHLDRHPHVAAQDRAVTVADADLALARADYGPDWGIQMGYGHRPDFPDYATVQVEVGLPVFTRNRQDRNVEAKATELARAESLKADWIRQHRSSIALNVADWERIQKRLERYDTAILPQAAQRLEAALAAYGAGSGTLPALLDARRGLLDIRTQKLDLQMDSARHQIELQYFTTLTSEALP